MPDFRYALRMVAKNPGYTAVAALTLAIGVGANTAMFSTCDALLLRPIDVPEIHRLYAVFGTRPGRPLDTSSLSPAEFLHLRQTQSLEHVSVADWWDANITGTGDPERVHGFKVSGEFFQAIGAPAQLGRTILPGEDREGKDDVVVLSRDFWLRRFGGDPHALGTHLELDGRKYLIVGVMPKGIRVPRAGELWVPLAFTPKEAAQRGDDRLHAVARLKHGVTREQAEQELSALARRMAEQFPDTNKDRGARLALYREHISGDLTADYTKLSLVSTLFVLLIACVNVANLQFARISGRNREMAVRTALGATRRRLVTQLLAEGGIVGLLALVAGLLIAIWQMDLTKGAMPPEVERWLPGWHKIGLSYSTFAVAFLAAMSASLLAALAPAWMASRVNLNEGLREGGRSATSGTARHRVRSVLVVAEVVLALVLLVGAGLTARGFRAIDNPLAPEVASQTLAMSLSLPVGKYKEAKDTRQFTDRVLQNVRALPGVKGAGLMMDLPYNESASSSSIWIEGAEQPKPGERHSAQRQVVSPGLFGLLAIPILRGRDVADADGADSPRVAVINEAFAIRYFAGVDPVGRRFRTNAVNPWIMVVGVSKDHRHHWIESPIRPAFFLPYRQTALRSFSLALRTDGDPRSMIAAARAQVLAVDRDQPVFDVMTVERIVSNSLRGLAYVAWMLGISGLIALILAMVGVYSVMASAVSERTHEIGIRLALGARDNEVLWMVLRRGMSLTGIGLAVGTACAWAMARAISGLLFGVGATDFVSYAGVLLLLAGTAFAACWFPARRAMKTDPVIALRHE